MDRAAGLGISVVIPAYNAAAELADTVAKVRGELAALELPLEILVVDDGSTDGTTEVAARTRGVRLVRGSFNRGKGWAVWRGVMRSSFPVVCFTDADAPFLSGSYRAVVEPVVRGAPFVIGSRRLAGSEMLVSMTALNYAARRHLIGISFNRFVRWILPLTITDTQCGLKAFQRSVGVELCQRIRSLRYLFDVELLLAAHALSVPIREVPVSVAYRDRKTSLRLFRESVLMGAGLLAIAWRAYRGAYLQPNPKLRDLEVQESELVSEAVSSSAR
ncbi:MAG: glycosyl transferase [Candidatus Binatia bacterium]|nr:MAG: glycosyl transferase [Candidatus Binatia bacterium]